MAALSHIRVIDMSRVLAGPWAGQTLADLGADVIKIEQPGKGDDTRGWGPPFVKNPSGYDTKDSAYFLCANRGKKSMTLDIRSSEGQKILRELVMKSDVLLENFKVGNLKKYGLDYASLSATNPGLIYCSITGFGQDGPYHQRPGYDFMIQALGGLMSVTGERDDAVGGGPQKVGVALSDVLTGLYATIAVQAALIQRDKLKPDDPEYTGQYIDLALLDVQAACLANMATNYFVAGEAPKRWGNAHPNIVPYQVFPTSDGHIVIAVGNDQQFARFCSTIKKSEWASDPRFEKNADRVRNRETLSPLIRDVIQNQSSDYWLETLENDGIPCGPINTLDKVFENPQIQHRNMKINLSRENSADVSLVANPIKFSENKIEYELPPPLLSQHTDLILSNLLGKSSDEIERLKKEGVI